jgi:hypothetical protein
VLVNHEQVIPVDSVCANLALKYNMLYVSAHQQIRSEIQNKTQWGQSLEDGRRNKDLAQAAAGDEETLYSPVHFNQTTVLQLLKETINAKTTNQKFVLVEGLCNSQKLNDVNDQLGLRLMDEFFNIESRLGEVKAVIGLQFTVEEDFIDEKKLQWEEFPEKPVEEVKVKPEGEDDEDEQPPAEDEDEEGEKKPVFNKEEFKWTISNRQPKNLPQLYQGQKGINALIDKISAEDYGPKKEEQVGKAMDEFCHRLHESDNQDKYLYRQIIFNNA